MTTLLITCSILGVIYVAIGIWACTWGPLHGRLHRFRCEMGFGLTLQDWAKSWEGTDPANPPPQPISRWRWWATLVSVHVCTLLGWPVFSPEAWRLQREELRKMREYMAARPYQRLANHGFGGNVRFYCMACRHTEVVPSSPKDRSHGICDTEPAQCLVCRSFSWARLEKLKMLSSQHCTCGGQLSRDHPTLCPQCGSEDVRLMHFSAWVGSPLHLQHEADMASQSEG